MVKSKQLPDAKRLTKLRAAVRNVWQYDYIRKEYVTGATRTNASGHKVFSCPLCATEWPIELATVDHEPELGSFTLETFGDWTRRCFYGPMRVICKPCHKRKKKPSRRNK